MQHPALPAAPISDRSCGAPVLSYTYMILDLVPYANMSLDSSPSRRRPPRRAQLHLKLWSAYPVLPKHEPRQLAFEEQASSPRSAPPEAVEREHEAHEGPPSPPVPAKPNTLYSRGSFVDIVRWTVS